MKGCILSIDANDPKLLLDAPLYGARSVIFDLTMTSAEHTDSARILLQEAIKSLGYQSIDVLIQINSGAAGMKDILTLAGSKPTAFILPGATQADICAYIAEVERAEQTAGIPEGSIKIILSSNRNQLESDEIAKRVIAVILEDNSRETSLCRIAGRNFGNGDEFQRAVTAKQLGFSAIITGDASQIEAIDTAFSREG